MKGTTEYPRLGNKSPSWPNEDSLIQKVGGEFTGFSHPTDHRYNLYKVPGKRNFWYASKNASDKELLEWWPDQYHPLYQHRA